MDAGMGGMGRHGPGVPDSRVLSAFIIGSALRSIATRRTDDLRGELTPRLRNQAVTRSTASKGSCDLVVRSGPIRPCRDGTCQAVRVFACRAISLTVAAQ